MRLSLMKAAHADIGAAPLQEIRVAHRFRPTYALANVGHPSDFLQNGRSTKMPYPLRWFAKDRATVLLVVLAAAAGGAAAHASVTAAVADHDGSAGVAAWCVTHVEILLHGVCCMKDGGAFAGFGHAVDAAVFHASAGPALSRRASFGQDATARRPGFIPHFVSSRFTRSLFRQRQLRAGSEASEQAQLMPGEEPQLEPAEDVVHDGLGEANLLVAGPA
jgi:hypothetical protein